jgi:DNA-directed RNA polymerase specialized sigma24 family protein
MNLRQARQIRVRCYEDIGMEVVPIDGVTSRELPEQFANFYDASFREVHRYLLRAVLGNHALAEDLTQDTFMAALVAARSGRAEALSMAWLMGAPATR